MPYLPVDTAVFILVGPIVDDTDFKSRESLAFDAAGINVDLVKTSVTGEPTSTDLTLAESGDNKFGSLSNGRHYVHITAAQNNTEGQLQIDGIATGVLPFMSALFDVVPVAVYNSLVKGTDNLEVDAVAISGDGTAADNCESMFDGTGYDASASTITAAGGVTATLYETEPA
jgi:hypothetical protein